MARCISSILSSRPSSRQRMMRDQYTNSPDLQRRELLEVVRPLGHPGMMSLAFMSTL
jgi:hypothetical protein